MSVQNKEAYEPILISVDAFHRMFSAGRTFIETQREGLGGRPTPDAASALPASVVREIGLWTHRSPRIDLAVLSALAYRYRLSRMDDTTWMREILKKTSVQSDPDLPELLDLQPGMVWVSQQRVAKDLRARWRFADPTGRAFGTTTDESREWKKFYENVRNAFNRLEKTGHIRRLRDVQLHGKIPASMGSVFTLDGTPTGEMADKLYNVPAPRALLLHPRGADVALNALLDGAGDDEAVPVVDLVGAALVAFAEHRGRGGKATPEALREASPLVAAGAFDYSEVRRAVAGDHKWAQFRRWTSRQAKKRRVSDEGPYAERHVSVGAWRKGVTGDDREYEPCAVPWLVLDFDQKSKRGERDIEATFEAAQRVVKELVWMGVRPDDMLCAYTGGDGFHVHVPTGAFGTPLFRDASAAKAWLKTLVSELVDEELDPAVLSPLHLIRAVGSGYHAPPEGMPWAAAAVLPPARFKQRIPTERFLSMTVVEAVHAGETFTPTKLDDPRGVAPVVMLAQEAAVCAAPRFKYVPTGRGGKTDAVGEVEGGVEEGIRNWAAFVMATHYLDKEGMEAGQAHDALERWNLQNRPPLGISELARVMANAEEQVFGYRRRKTR